MYLLARLSVVLVVASVLLTMLAVASATMTAGEEKGGSVRRSLADQQHEQPSPQQNSGPPTNGQPRMLITAGTVVELVLNAIDYGATTHYPQGHSEELWEMRLSDEDSARLGGMQDVELVHPEHMWTASHTPISSGDSITLHEDFILMDNKVHVPREANVEFSHSNPHDPLNGIGMADTKYAAQTAASVRDPVQQAIQRRENDDTDEEIGTDEIGLSDHSNGGTILNNNDNPSPLPREVRIVAGEHTGGEETNSNGVQERRKRRTNRRNLASFTAGPLTTLVIRVIDAVGSSITNGKEGAEQEEITMAKLEDDVFLDASSLKTQYEACSYGKLQIIPYSGTTSQGRTITNGVTELVLPTYQAQGGDRKQIKNAALAAVKTDISHNMYQEFDLILFCMPPGTNATYNTTTGKSEGSWMAYAVIGGQTSYYNNQWCGYVAAQMHEVGHNLGLYHSREEFIDPEDPTKNELSPYGDTTGMMGSAHGMDDTKMCFNPAKNWQLQWYENQSKVLNPLIDLEMKSNNYQTRVTLNGVSDYGKNDQAIVVLQLGHDEEPAQTDTTENYFIGFNRASGINAQTREDGDRVTIVRKTGDPLQRGFSTKIAKGLSVFESYIIHDFEPGRDVEIKFVGLANDEALDNFGRDATIDIVDVSNFQEQGPSDEKNDNCRTYTITTTTDDYKNDNKWFIVEKGGIGARVATSPIFPANSTTYDEELCLPYDTCYMYTITDEYGDGICCDQGEGGFKIEDLTSDSPEYVLGGGTYYNDLRAVREDGDIDLEKKKEILFCVGPNPNPPEELVVDNNDNLESNDQMQNNTNTNVDDLDYLFQNKKGKDCKVWVAEEGESESRCAKIDKKNENKVVSEFCLFTCSNNNNETEDNNTNENSDGDDDECLDTVGKFKQKGKNMNCKKVIKKNQCKKKYKGDDENFKGEKLSKLCPVSCEKC